MNVNDFKGFECYKKSKLRFEKEIDHEKVRYESDLQDGLDVASDCPSWSQVVTFKEAECDWLVLDTVDCSIELTGARKEIS